MTDKQYNDRVEYIKKLMTLGLSRYEAVNRFMKVYGVGESMAQNWWTRTQESLRVHDPEESSRSRTQVLEILHGQVVGLHLDLLALDKQIDDIQTASRRRREILALKDGASKTERIRLNLELAGLPKLKPMAVIAAIESKAKIRDKICTASMQIARLHSLLDRPMAIITAIEKLAESELIPAATANDLIGLLNGLERRIDELN